MDCNRSTRASSFALRIRRWEAIPCRESAKAGTPIGVIVTVLFLGFVANSLGQSTNAASTNRTPTRVVVVRPVSTIEDFRELLQMSPLERERALALKPADKREMLMAKIAEYQAMTPAERELRLRMTQLRQYLVPLMKSTPAQREKLLSRFSADDRAMFERRLKIWDEIPVQLQREFLANEANLGFFIKWKDISAEQRHQLLQTFPPERRSQLEKDLEKWSTMPASQRKQLSDHFNEFFELNDHEKEKTLAALPESERRQMEETLTALESLSAEERRKCIENFRQFIRMSPEERRQFLNNAERWHSLSSTERQAWRELMQRTPPPPLPPGMVPAPPVPPNMGLASTNRVK